MADDKKRDEYNISIEMSQPSSRSRSPMPSRLSPTPFSPKRPSSAQSMMKNLNSAMPSAKGSLDQPIIAIFAYCGSSILMTVTNKYVLSGIDFNMNFLLLSVQNVVCILAIQSCKTAGIISYRDFNSAEAKKWFPISLLLIGMIYTSTKALQFLSIPVYTIFKNLTTILIAYGEVLWFGGSVTSMALFSFGLMVLSSIVAAWADIQHALQKNYSGSLGLSSHGSSASASVNADATKQLSNLNAGYIWMLINCLCTATYLLAMRKRIKITNFKDFDTCSLTLESWTPANLSLNFPPATRNSIITSMVLSGLSSLFISYTSAWCVRVTSSTTYSMVGALNKLPIALSGLVFFDAPITVGSVGAIAIGFVSGIVYAVAKVRQGQGQQKTVLPTVSASSLSMRDSLKS
ncbi:MAG: GDP-mannose transporter into the lumen of the Golgi [Bogoriella megaspora]|nr:MAG: GDP-mannose transporter into the lumen of the Golgi [Bogoriella megaspora]